ncbi:MAG: hypothetical protein Q7S52_03610, partial [bacterium]|nr:hypothetical protein [bacterium]
LTLISYLILLILLCNFIKPRRTLETTVMVISAISVVFYLVISAFFFSDMDIFRIINTMWPDVF